MNSHKSNRFLLIPSWKKSLAFVSLAFAGITAFVPITAAAEAATIDRETFSKSYVRDARAQYRLIDISGDNTASRFEYYSSLGVYRPAKGNFKGEAGRQFFRSCIEEQIQRLDAVESWTDFLGSRDRSGDSTVSVGEYRAHALNQAGELFTSFDTNTDDQLVEQEQQAYQVATLKATRRSERQAERANETCSTQMRTRVSAQQYVNALVRAESASFQAMDINSDSQLSRGEYFSSLGLLRPSNSNYTGTLAEYRACVETELESGSPLLSWSQLVNMSNSDDLFLLWSEYGGGKKQAAGETFVEFDIDEDGYLEQTELTAAETAMQLLLTEQDAQVVQVDATCLAGNVDDLGNGTGTASSTEGVLCGYYDSTYNDSASVEATSTSSWVCTTTDRVLAANGLPDHLVGTFPNPQNPNAITEQSISATFTLTPTETTTATELGGPRGVTGYVLNGVKIDAGTGGSCDDSGTSCNLANPTGSWGIEALGQSSFDFGTDENNAHVQPGGQYHYHGIPEGFVQKQGGSPSSMTLIGWAADGFPIYARYGYSDADDATSPMKNMKGSYRVVTSVSASRPSIETYALGTFRQDWMYVEGAGDLDECNGRVGVTPEFPTGIYHYYATDTYPYFQRCVRGAVDAGGGGNPGGPPPG